MRKLRVVLGVLTLTCGLLTGCGKKEEPTTEATTELTTEATPTEATLVDATPEDAEEELPAIGKESEEAIKTKITNKTGKDITGVAIKNMEDDTWSDNLLEDEDVFTDTEKRYLYYTPEQDETGDEDEMVTYEGFDIQLTFADESVETLHAVSLQDVKDGEIMLEDDVCYLAYTSIATDKQTDMKAEELAIKEQEKAEKEAADAKAAAESEAAQQAVTEAPAPATEAPATEAPAPADNGGDDDECLGDGLTY